MVLAWGSGIVFSHYKSTGTYWKENLFRTLWSALHQQEHAFRTWRSTSTLLHKVSRALGKLQQFKSNYSIYGRTLLFTLSELVYPSEKKKQLWWSSLSLLKNVSVKLRFKYSRCCCKEREENSCNHHSRTTHFHEWWFESFAGFNMMMLIWCWHRGS